VSLAQPAARLAAALERRGVLDVTVAHPWNQEQAAPAGDDGGPSVRPGHPLVVVDRVEGREPRVADAVEEEEEWAPLESL